MLDLPHRLAALALLLATLTPPAAAQMRRFESPSGTWRALVIPGNVGSAPGRASVQLSGPGDAERRYELSNAIAPVEVVLLDDGTLVTFDEWEAVGLGDVAVCYGLDGAQRWKRGLDELLPGELLARVPQGSRSRPWRRGVPRVHAEPDGAPPRELRVPLWNADELALVLADGAARHLEIADHGEDAEAWAASARDLMARGRYEEAAAELERALVLEPGDTRTWNDLANAWRRAGDVARAVSALERGVAANPVEGGSEDPLSQARRNVWLLVQLALAYAEVGETGKAQAAAVRALEVEPGSWPAVQLRARHLAAQGAGAELDALAQRAFDAMSAPPGGPGHEQRLLRAALLVGRLLKDAGRLEAARDVYRRGLEAPYEESLLLALAEVHEALGEREQALEVLAQVLEALLRAQVDQDGEEARRTAERIAELEARIAALADDGDER